MTTKEKIIVLLIILFCIFGKSYDNKIQAEARYQAVKHAEQVTQERYDIIYSDNY